MKKLVLDLDETLIYSAMEPLDDDFVKLSAAGQTFYTKLRPGLKDFLEFVKSKFDVTIWTTGHQAYLESIWAYLDIPGFVLWGRDYCKKIQSPDKDCVEPYEKPLRLICEDLTQIVIVDNTPSIFAKYPLNGILSRTWRGDPEDTELTNHAARSSGMAPRNAVHPIQIVFFWGAAPAPSHGGTQRGSARISLAK